MSLALELIGLAGWLTILGVVSLDWDTPVTRRRYSRAWLRVRWAWRQVKRSIKSLA